ncbi:MAG TPA: TIGR04086 family membrane protein [Candidatus Monoglobus merdigallinarum]|uniref:TIGR04086 family membrane protein n=1 Tax=Candidatus Monoglobus merdigallinarum TaxID=2838698 RepID=A0A9D1PQK7_9FIRM|nr:TIGR04086 family membrane protein [Candidatus Monoglobus merdigallinarum]
MAERAVNRKTGARPAAENADASAGIGISVAKGLISGLLAAAAVLFIVSVLAVFYDFSETLINYIIIGVSVVCLFLSGLVSASCAGRNGLILGGLTGAVYTIIIFILRCIVFQNAELSPELIANIAVGGALGALGGIIGINKRSGKRRRRR